MWKSTPPSGRGITSDGQSESDPSIPISRKARQAPADIPGIHHEIQESRVPLPYCLLEGQADLRGTVDAAGRDTKTFGQGQEINVVQVIPYISPRGSTSI